MAQQAQKGLLWRDNDMGELAPTWTIVPDLSVIKSVAVEHLPEGYTDINVSFFAEGSFNKLYCVSSPHISQKYFLRVALPVEPFFKTESEVATLAYIRKHTTIPVPKVLAYCSSSDCELGFEWILMEKIEGVPLSDIWNEMSFDSKESLTLEMCNHLKVLHDLPFTQIGNLYFRSVSEQVGTGKSSGGLETNSCKTAIDRGIGTEFVIGRVVSPWFFRDKRISLSAARGPFSCSYQYMMAKTRMQIERIKHLSPLPTDDYYSETDELLAEDQEDVLDTCHSLEALVPHIFSPHGRDDEDNLLYHDDLSASNIIVDPISHRVTGVVDWECVSIHPAWEAAEFPFFLRGIEVPEPPPQEPGIVEPDLVEIRKDWEKVCLRRLYRKTLQDNFELSPDIMRKQKFSFCLENIEMNWTASQYWAQTQLEEPGLETGPTTLQS
ncbi:hypothetical protein N7466_004003 [Penicillium verhagenii]|uniref:uncharacterized protein n=1 Tax=Penicillium verhagenii TaxID=1562060 RepID=UPI0025455A74|nr:uncharacterized protein N7466_004003 [Penicillium verhagenii]KAJ5934456.1 hypothetical protein N7466_004003 [Penicillium verhagenii]